MIRTLYVRVVLTFLAVIIIALISSSLIGLKLFEKRIDQLGHNNMSATGQDIIRISKQTTLTDIDEFLDSIISLISYPLQIFTDTGEMKSFSSDNDKDVVKISPDLVQKVLQGQLYRSSSKDAGTFVGMPFTFEGKRYALFLQSSTKNEGTILSLFLTILLLVLVTGSLGILVAARYLVKPLKALTNATNQLAKGNFDVVLKVKRNDELGALAQSFNHMASELKQLEQMRQDFVSNVSHEIQSPLTSISGFAKALKIANLVSESEGIQYLDIILAESERLSRLGDHLLKLASLESEHHPFEATTYNLDEQIRQVVVACEPLWMAKNINIDLQLPNVSKITADSDQLNQVWLNLLGNSIKFTPDGGQIHIDMSHSKGEYIITLTDSGCGISSEDLQHVFERFYKADLSRNRNVQGSGLGLAIVKKIVALHHGSIEVKSTYGEGTTVIVKLPSSF